MKKILKIAIISLIATPVFAQDEYYAFRFLDQDALRLTMPSLQGNARFVGMGGAFGALGGNLSALSTNPASIGLYRRGEISFTPALTFGQTEVRPADDRSRMSDPLWNFNMGNFGMVSAFDISRSDSPNEWKMVHFGIGFNRIADFWNRSSYTRYASNPFLNVLTSEATMFGHPNYLTDDFFSGLAYDANLIHWDSATNEYWNWLNETGNGLRQTQTTRTTGAINEFVISFGANYGDFLYLGATIGVPSVNFTQEKFLRETALPGQHPNFREWSIQENLTISGRGINLKLGAIVRPTDFMRVGLAFHTPTRFSLTEEFRTTITNNENRRFRSPVTEFEYSIRTPMRVIGSLGFIINRTALISMEYEVIDYRGMRLNDDFHSFDEDNEFIENNYRTGGVFRIGAEFRLDPVSIRAGYNYTLSPFASNTYRNFSGHTFSGGLGFRLGTTTIDLAYVNTMRRFNKSPYAGMPNDFFNRYSQSAHQFMVTFGWRF